VPEHRAGKGRESVQQLYLVGFSADRKSFHLSRSPGHRPDFRLEADDELVALLAQRQESGTDATSPPVERVEGEVEAATQAPEPDAPHGLGTRSRSRLSPREIQARLRNGLTVHEVADEAGVDIAWVDRFAAPILAEQAAALERACRLSLTSARKGSSAAPLGVALARNLEERGVRPSAEVDPWSAHLHHDNTWVIRYSYRWRGRVMEAEWLADLSAGALGARNRLATELGWLDPDLDSPRPAPGPPAPVPPEAEPLPVGRTARVAGAAAPTKRSRPGLVEGRRVAGAPAPAKAAPASIRGRRAGGAAGRPASDTSNGSIAPISGSSGAGSSGAGSSGAGSSGAGSSGAGSSGAGGRAFGARRRPLPGRPEG
jgi:uncharacterized membrane protein YgcG